MPKIWTIHPGDVIGPSSTKDDLVGCHIKKNDAETAYEFTDNNPNVVLSTTPGSSLPTPPFQFPSFGLDGYTWVVTVNTVTGGPSGDSIQGNWTNNAPNPAEAEGTYTAQAGAGVDADEDREAAASA